MTQANQSDREGCNPLEQAKSGDAKAIAALMNSILQPEGITAKAALKNGCLHVILEGDRIPNQQTLVPWVHQVMFDLDADACEQVKVYGRKMGEDFTDWDESLQISRPSEEVLRKVAQKGNIKAINILIERWFRELQGKNLAVKSQLKNNCLQVVLEAGEIPEREGATAIIPEKLIELAIESCQIVKIFGRQTGDEFPDWQEEFELKEKLISPSPAEAENGEGTSSALVNTRADNPLLLPKQPQQSSFWGSLSKRVASAGGAIADTASKAGKSAVGKAKNAIADTASQASQVIAEKAKGVSDAIADTASQASQVIVEKAKGVGGTIADTASQASQNVVKKATDTVAPLVNSTVKTLENAKKNSTDWLIRIIDKVDVVKAETEVRQIEQQYPDEQPNQIAHRLMVDKALITAGTGLASNLLPGAALAMMGVDLAATTALSAELVYQIAAAYGLNLQASDRKGEVLTIFGLSLSGNLAIDAGLGLLGKVPVAGAVINASSNAAMIYALGYGACRYYEAKLNSASTPAALEVSQAESEKYLAEAIAQQAVMDRILVRVVLAGNPGKTWEELLPDLQTLNLSRGSLDAIAASIDSPPLETLLEQINGDFAVPLLAQCQKIAQLDGVVTPEEAQLIETITQQLGVAIHSHPVS